MMWGYGQGYWLGMGVTMILFWALIIAGIVVLVRYIGGARNAERVRATAVPVAPEDALAMRFARGEIDADEYQRSLELLRAQR